MAQQRSKRKKRQPQAAPRSVPSERREVRAAKADRETRQRQATKRAVSSPKGQGDRPPSPFGFPLSEIAIGIGLIGCLVGFFAGNGPALGVGGLVTGLGVLEFTIREHVTGFRSHTTILAAVPALIVFILFAVIVNPTDRALLLLPAIPVFLVAFWLLRKRFKSARQRRVVRAPSAR